MDTTIDLLVKEVLKLAEEYPNGVYCSNKAHCEYHAGKVKDGPKTEGCIIGQANQRIEEKYRVVFPTNTGMGVHAFFLERIDLNRTSIWTLGKLIFLAKVQGYQDERQAWGECVKKAQDITES